MDHHFQLQMMFLLLLLHRALLLMGQHLIGNIVGVIRQTLATVIKFALLVVQFIGSRWANTLVIWIQVFVWVFGQRCHHIPIRMESYWRSFVRRDFIGGFINPLTLLGDLFSRRFAMRCMLNGYANIKDNIRNKCSVMCACKMTPFELTMWPLPTVHIGHPRVGHGEGECMYVRVPCAKMQGCHVVCSSFWISRTSDLQLWVDESQQVVQSFLVSSCCDCVVQV